MVALVVGAGPVSLTASILLARHGLRSTVIDRFKTRRGAPTAHAINPRSLEICRSAGLDLEEMKRRATPPGDGGWVQFVTTLSGEEIGVLPYERRDEQALDVTPTPLINLAQPLFEDGLLEEVSRSPLIRLRRGINWIGCTQDEDAVTSLVEDVETHGRTQITTRYVIEADGAGSVVRRKLGIGMVGATTPSDMQWRRPTRRKASRTPSALSNRRWRSSPMVRRTPARPFGGFAILWRRPTSSSRSPTSASTSTASPCNSALFPARKATSTPTFPTSRRGCWSVGASAVAEARDFQDTQASLRRFVDYLLVAGMIGSMQSHRQSMQTQA